MDNLFDTKYEEQIKKLETIIADQKLKYDKLFNMMLSAEAHYKNYHYSGAREAKRQVREREAERERYSDEARREAQEKQIKEDVDEIVRNLDFARSKPRTLLEQLTDQMKKDFKAKIISVEDSKVIHEFIARFIHDKRS